MKPQRLGQRIFHLAAAAAVLSANGCEDGGTEPQPPDPPRPTAVTVAPATAQLAALDATVQLSAEAFDANGHGVAGAEFEWGSSDDAVATVNGSGLVTAAGNGTATITATTGGASGAAAVTVAQVVSTVRIVEGADQIGAQGRTLPVPVTVSSRRPQRASGCRGASGLCR